MASKLTQAQLQTLKTHINASSDLNIFPNTDSGNFNIKELLNLAASPSFTAWRKEKIPLTNVGDSMDWAEVAGLTTGNNTRLQTMAAYSPSGIDPAAGSAAGSRRAAFQDIFSAASGVNTRTALATAWTKLCSRFERLYATGTGNPPASGNLVDSNVGTLVVVGPATSEDVQEARNLP